MLQLQPLQPVVFSAARRVVKRRIALEKRDDGRAIVERKQFAKAPYAAAVRGLSETARDFQRSRRVVPSAAVPRRTSISSGPPHCGTHVNSFRKAVRTAARRCDAALQGAPANLRWRACNLFSHHVSGVGRGEFLRDGSGEGKLLMQWRQAPPSCVVLPRRTKCCTPKSPGRSQ